MALSPQDALVYLMVVTASADATMTEIEYGRIDGLISALPVFQGYDRDLLPVVVNACVDLINDGADIEKVLDDAVAALPERLHDTAYLLVVEVASVDLTLEQEELRLLEMVRDRLALDRLVTAAIEATARARYRRP